MLRRVLRNKHTAVRKLCFGSKSRVLHEHRQGAVQRVPGQVVHPPLLCRRFFTRDETLIPYVDLDDDKIAALTGDPELIVSLRIAEPD